MKFEQSQHKFQTVKIQMCSNVLWRQVYSVCNYCVAQQKKQDNVHRGSIHLTLDWNCQCVLAEYNVNNSSFSPIIFPIDLANFVSL